MTGELPVNRCLSDLPFDSTSQSLPVCRHIDDPARQLLHLPQDVLAQMLSHQPGQARFVTLQGRSTPLEFWNQARQFCAFDEAEEDRTGFTIKGGDQWCPIQALGCLLARVCA